MNIKGLGIGVAASFLSVAAAGGDQQGHHEQSRQKPHTGDLVRIVREAAEPYPNSFT